MKKIVISLLVLSVIASDGIAKNRSPHRPHVYRAGVSRGYSARGRLNFNEANPVNVEHQQDALQQQPFEAFAQNDDVQNPPAGNVAGYNFVANPNDNGPALRAAAVLRRRFSGQHLQENLFGSDDEGDQQANLPSFEEQMANIRAAADVRNREEALDDSTSRGLR